MILDYADEFTTAGGQAVTAEAIGTIVKDAGAGNTQDWGAGKPIFPWVRITADANFNPTTSATFAIIAADNAALSSNPVVLSTITVLVAALLLNTMHAMPALLGGTRKRYLGCKITPNGGSATTGKVKVGLVSDTDARQQSTQYV